MRDDRHCRWKLEVEVEWSSWELTFMSTCKNISSPLSPEVIQKNAVKNVIYYTKIAKTLRKWLNIYQIK